MRYICHQMLQALADENKVTVVIFEMKDRWKPLITIKTGKKVIPMMLRAQHFNTLQLKERETTFLDELKKKACPCEPQHPQYGIVQAQRRRRKQHTERTTEQWCRGNSRTLTPNSTIRVPAATARENGRTQKGSRQPRLRTPGRQDKARGSRQLRGGIQRRRSHSGTWTESWSFRHRPHSSFEAHLSHHEVRQEKFGKPSQLNARKLSSNDGWRSTQICNGSAQFAPNS